jgi:hypothetical protein
MSMEIDILPLVDDGEEAARLADLIEVWRASGRRSTSSAGAVTCDNGDLIVVEGRWPLQPRGQ